MIMNQGLLKGKVVQQIKTIELSEYLLDTIEEKCTRPWKVKDLNGHTEEVNCVAYSPLGDYIVSGSKDNEIILWDARSEYFHLL